MTPKGGRFRVFLDAGVPDSVGETFAKHGHGVFLHRDVLPERTFDQVVAATAMANDAVLVAQDRDLRRITTRYGSSPDNSRFEGLSMIAVCCKESLAAKRVDHVMSLIEHEWAFTRRKAARRMWIDVAAHFVRSYR